MSPKTYILKQLSAHQKKCNLLGVGYPCGIPIEGVGVLGEI